MEGALLALVLLACPVGMGLMMWFMGRRQRSEQEPPSQPDARSLDELRDERARLSAEIDQLEREPAHRRVVRP